MLGELVELKPEIRRAEREFYNAIMKYLLDTHDTSPDVEAAIAEVRETIINYRSVLERLNRCLDAVSRHETPVRKQSINDAIARLHQRNIALEALLLHARRKSPVS